ncbi:hypothetical protein BBH88_04570 [Planococcus antarcticus DSM 14505]|uniref:Uncharacterized protein n=1 Tax=Planococcus antarcticus DSM 14505 TaxID=1185653 RepID=A0ABM6D213_9BACL|nr:hypothetical protein [Planococcus antarcticus]ANU09620.1 hypothetical protein BBH88_04570 [Planococcus antarcticus DSM 14505]
MRNSNKWFEEIVVALISLDGKGSLEEIYKRIQKQDNIDFNSYTDWKSQVRKNLYLNSSDCKIFKGITGDQNDLFYSIEGIGKGYWGIRKFNNFKNKEFA